MKKEIILFFYLWIIMNSVGAVMFEAGKVKGITSTALNESYTLYKQTTPFHEGTLQVSKRHQIYFSEYGNPKGMPVVVLHGGPGAGSDPNMARVFDPTFFRVVLFDQRGSGQSTPAADMEENNTQALIEDIEKLRKHLNIKSWLVMGGSWGSTLAMLYGEAHPDKVKGFMLRGVTRVVSKEYNHLIYGMGSTFPEAWDEFVKFLPENERSDLLNSYHKRIMSSDPKVHLPAAKAFVKYDTQCGIHLPDDAKVQKLVDNDKFALSISRGFLHYAANQFFIEEDQVLKNIDKIKHLPAYIVHGRYDTICRAENAYEVFKAWPASSLTYIEDAGHFHSEPGISLGLLAAAEQFKTYLHSKLENGES